MKIWHHLIFPFAQSRAVGGKVCIYQVWPLTQFFFLFPPSQKIIDLLEGKSMTPHRGNTILCSSSQQLSHLGLESF